MTYNDGMSERTLILIKPDAVKRGLVGEILARICLLYTSDAADE